MEEGEGHGKGKEKGKGEEEHVDKEMLPGGAPAMTLLQQLESQVEGGGDSERVDAKADANDVDAGTEEKGVPGPADALSAGAAASVV